MTLLEVRDLRVGIGTAEAPHPLVAGIAFEARPGELVCIVGESGSGKSVAGRALLGLSGDVGLAASGSVLFDGEDLLSGDTPPIERLRGREIGFVPQDPQSSLDPLFTIGFLLREAIRHRDGRETDWRARAIELLEQVEMPEPERRLHQYPHELSGGQAQRVLIAIALAGRPRLLVADEATSALDATVKLQVLDLLERLRRSTGLAVLLITHDIAVARKADRIVVLYAGTVLESGPAARVIEDPRHPYTAGLVASVPSVDAPAMIDRSLRLPSIGGSVPSPAERPGGCVFRDRCPAAVASCARPIAIRADPAELARATACHRVLEDGLDARILFGGER